MPSTRPLIHHRLLGDESRLVESAIAANHDPVILVEPGSPPGALAALEDPPPAICVVRDPVQHACSLYERAQAAAQGQGRAGAGRGAEGAALRELIALGREIADRGWSLADVYRELGGPTPRRSQLHERFAGFFNGQSRALLAAWDGDGPRLEHWAGVPARAAALRDRALQLLATRYVPGTHERLGESLERWSAALGWQAGSFPRLSHWPREPEHVPDAETRALIVAHNQLDVELHAHCSGIVARGAARPSASRRPAGDERPPDPPPGDPICVLGMSRSGTSVTARILNVLGVELGREDDLMPAAAGNNPTGFWEHEGIVALNEEILGELTGETPRPRPMWFRPPPLPVGWERDPRLAPYREAARKLLRESFEGVPLWGWKDPRTCLTLPFWHRLVPELRHVICVRHPLDVAASLEARDGAPRKVSLWLWLLHTAHAVLNTRGRERVFVAHEAYFPDWEPQAERLARFVGLDGIAPDRRAAIAGHLDGKLWHHREGAHEPLLAEVEALYRPLASLAARSSDAPTAAQLDDAAAAGADAAEEMRPEMEAEIAAQVRRRAERRRRERQAAREEPEGTGAAERQQVVCILGTPRSGSSLTTRVLNIAGLYIGGDEDLTPAGPGNPTGFWETRRAARVNHRILATLGIGNADAPRLAPGWERSPRLAAELEEARAVVAEIFGGHRAWGWKDPRNSITLPFWRQAVSPTRHVICLRNPVDMASSGGVFAAERGGGLDAATGFALWECYIASAIVNTAGEPRVFAAYESYFDDWRAAADRLARFACLESPIGTPREEELERLLDDGLRHHRTPVAETLADPAVPEGVRALYRALQPHLDGPADPGASAGGEELDALARELLASSEREPTGAA